MAKNTFLLLLLLIPAYTITAEEDANSGSDYDLPKKLLEKLYLDESDGRKSRLSSSPAEFKAIVPPVIKVTPNKRNHSDTESDHERDDAMSDTDNLEHRQKRYRKTTTTKHVPQTIDEKSAEAIIDRLKKQMGLPEEQMSHLTDE